MRWITQFLKKYSAFIVLGVLLLPIVYFVIDEIAYRMYGACFTEVRDNVATPTGYNFGITYTDCDYGMGAGEYYTSVFAKRVGQAEKTLVFRYNSDPNDVPHIVGVGPHAVEISVPQINDLYSTRTHLDDLSILYKIGTIGYVTDDQIEQTILDKMKTEGRNHWEDYR